MPATTKLKGMLPSWKLAAVTFLLAGFWCVCLPRLADWGPVRTHMQLMNAKNVDASAMFYTELDVMEEILAKIEDR